MPSAPYGDNTYQADPPKLTPQQRAAVRKHLNEMKEEEYLEWLFRLRENRDYAPETAEDPRDWEPNSWLFGAPGRATILDQAHKEWLRRRDEGAKEYERLHGESATGKPAPEGQPDPPAPGLPPIGPPPSRTPRASPFGDTPSPRAPEQPWGQGGGAAPASVDTSAVAAAMAVQVLRKIKAQGRRTTGAQEF